MSPLVTVILAQLPTFVSLFEAIANAFKKKPKEHDETQPPPSNYRPRPLLFAFAILATALLATGYVNAATSSVTLAWDANTETDLAGYKLYRSSVAGGPYTLAQTLGKVTTTTLTGVVDGTHYFVLTAFDNKAPANESGYSNQVTFSADTIPPAAPRNVVITITVTVP